MERSKNEEKVVHGHSNATNKEAKDKCPTEDFVMEKINYQRTNRSRPHKYANVGETLSPVLHHGFEAGADIWEPILHLTQRKVLSYYKLEKLRIPETIDEADDG